MSPYAVHIDKNQNDTNLDEILLVHASSPDKDDDVDDDQDNDGGEDGDALEEVGRREDGVEIDCVRRDCEPAAERCQMGAETLGPERGGQWTDLSLHSVQ